jgi:hypothetical protein
LKDLQVTLRGKKYDISDVTTVKELKEKVKEISGNTKEHSVLFGGKKLASAVTLREAGVSDGDQLNMVPSSGSSKKQSTGGTKPVTSSSSTTTTDPKGEDGLDGMPSTDAMKEYLKQSGMDPAQVEQMMQSMDGKMPDLQESLQSMSQMMNSPMFQEYMSNPEMLEQSRQMILNNPMLKGMMGSMPGMEDLLNDPVAWREAMMAAAEMYKNLDGADLAKMMEGMNNMPGGSGLFNGELDNSAATAALDELDEDD